MIVKSLVNPYIKGLHLGAYTYLFSHILDHTISKEDTLNLMKKTPSLMNECATSNFINLIGVTPIYYIFVDNFLIIDKSMIFQPKKLLLLLLLHNFLFFIAHLSFHKFQSLLYIHKFHHKFNKPIPSSGNAVTLDEYNIAYVLPFLIGAYLIKPNDLSFRLAIGITSFLNALIHCIPLSNYSIGKLFIKPGDHIEHHEKWTVKYAAPLVNIDYILLSIIEYFRKERDYKYMGANI